jgi:hypothetical protein
VLAALFFREYADLTATFYIGVLIIISTVFIQPKISNR